MMKMSKGKRRLQLYFLYDDGENRGGILMGDIECWYVEANMKDKFARVYLKSGRAHCMAIPELERLLLALSELE